MSSPKTQEAKYQHEYYLAHKANFLAYGNTYRKTHKAQMAKRHHKYYLTHKAQKAAYMKVYYQTHRVQRATYDKVYYKAHRDFILTRRWEYSYRRSHAMAMWRHQYYCKYQSQFHPNSQRLAQKRRLLARAAAQWQEEYMRGKA